MLLNTLRASFDFDFFIKYLQLSLIFLFLVPFPLAFFSVFKILFFVSLILIYFKKSSFKFFKYWYLMVPGAMAFFIGVFNGYEPASYDLAFYIFGTIGMLVIFNYVSFSIKDIHFLFIICGVAHSVLIIYLFSAELLGLNVLFVTDFLINYSGFVYRHSHGFYNIYYYYFGELFYIYMYFFWYGAFNKSRVVSVLQILLLFCIVIVNRNTATLLVLLSTITFLAVWRIKGLSIISNPRSILHAFLVPLLVLSSSYISLSDNSDIIGSVVDAGSSDASVAASSELYSEPKYYSTISGFKLRLELLNHLIDGISRSPFFGSGIGYVNSDFIRSEAYPTRSEFTYLSQILVIGFVGFACYLFFYFISFLKVCQFEALNLSSRYYPVLLASLFASMLQFTNPYYYSVQGLVVLFTPYILLNMYEHKRT